MTQTPPSRPDVAREHRLTEPLHTHPGQAAPHTHPPVAAPSRPASGPLRIGIGGPVGSGKTALVAALCRTLGAEVDLAVVTNDIYTTEDGDFLVRHGVLPAERITAVQTGACPHTAIRDDIAMNLDAVEDLEERFCPDVVLVESGGDNLTATFSYGLVDAQVFVVDVAGGDKVPRKGGPGVITSDLLVVNKTDLALEPVVVAAGADLDATTTIDVAAGGHLDLTEQVVLGRWGEGPGRWRGTVRADLDGVPWLRQSVALGPGAPAWDALDAPRALVSRLCTSGAGDPAAAAASGSAVLLPLALGGTLLEALGTDLAAARRDAAALGAT